MIGPGRVMCAFACASLLACAGIGGPVRVVPATPFGIANMAYVVSPHELHVEFAEVGWVLGVGASSKPPRKLLVLYRWDDYEFPEGPRPVEGPDGSVALATGRGPAVGLRESSDGSIVYVDLDGVVYRVACEVVAIRDGALVPIDFDLPHGRLEADTLRAVIDIAYGPPES